MSLSPILIERIQHTDTVMRLMNMKNMMCTRLILLIILLMYTLIALLGLLIRYIAIKENNVSEIFTPLFVIRNSSLETFLFNVRLCDIIVPCAGPSPGSNPKIHPDMLPANVDFRNVLLIKNVLSSFCGGMLEFLLIEYNKLLILNNPDKIANNPILLLKLLLKTVNPRIPDNKNINEFFSLLLLSFP